MGYVQQSIAGCVYVQSERTCKCRMPEMRGEDLQAERYNADDISGAIQVRMRRVRMVGKRVYLTILIRGEMMAKIPKVRKVGEVE